MGMVVPVCNLGRQKAEGQGEGRGLKGILCPKGKQDSSLLIPGDGNFSALSYSQEVQGRGQTFILHSLCPRRCESLVEVNTELRLHMEKADVVNKALQEDVEKLTVDWSRARDELMRKESQWRMEQEVEQE